MAACNRQGVHTLNIMAQNHNDHTSENDGPGEDSIIVSVCSVRLQQTHPSYAKL